MGRDESATAKMLPATPFLLRAGAHKRKGPAIPFLHNIKFLCPPMNDVPRGSKAFRKSGKLLSSGYRGNVKVKGPTLLAPIDMRSLRTMVS